MKYSELKKLLKKNGCYLVREGANHEQWFSPKNGKTFFDRSSQGTRGSKVTYILRYAAGSHPLRGVVS
jgi:hypothetical protein